MPPKAAPSPAKAGPAPPASKVASPPAKAVAAPSKPLIASAPPPLDAKTRESNAITEARDAFAYYDRKKEGKIAVKDVAEIFRCVGMFPTDNDLKDLLKQAGASTHVTLDMLLKMVQLNSSKSSEYEAKLIEAFQKFDTENSGAINLRHFQKALQFAGDKLTEKQAKDFIRIAHFGEEMNDNSTLSYYEFVRIVCSVR